MKDFKVFIIITPGLEDLALQELLLKCPGPEYLTTKGGISAEVDLEWIERAHTILKIPTRVLLRLSEFKVRDFPKLYQKLQAFPWNRYLSHPVPQFEISCSKSRLLHTGRIEETVVKALAESLRKQPLSQDWSKKNYPPQTFYLRLSEDLLTLSLDLTGEPLYKRGYQEVKGEAPIRESFGAAMAFEILSVLEGPVTLIDPMCGSGTLLAEAKSFHLPMRKRSFAFESAPFYKGRSLKTPPPVTPFPIVRALGLDLNEELIARVKPSLGEQFGIELASGDCLEEDLSTEKNTIMLCNPPYGERIKIPGRRGVFLRNAWDKFLTHDRPLRFGWVLPSDMDDLFKSPAGYRLMTKRPFRNGGMAVTFWIWEKEDRITEKKPET